LGLLFDCPIALNIRSELVVTIDLSSVKTSIYDNLAFLSWTRFILVDQRETELVS